MKTLVAVTASLFLVAIYMIFFYTPTEAVMGIVQKIFYFHLPIAFSGFFSFFVAFICAILYLIKKEKRWDIYSASSVEIGVMLTTLVLITGSLWARPIWNTWWTWDPRLTTALILWLIYAAYLILRMSIEQEGKRASFCAVMAIIGFVDVPIVFFSARLWRTIHPVVLQKDKIALASSMKLTLLVSMIAFFALWALLFKLRTKNLFLNERINKINNTMNQ